MREKQEKKTGKSRQLTLFDCGKDMMAVAKQIVAATEKIKAKKTKKKKKKFSELFNDS